MRVAAALLFYSEGGVAQSIAAAIANVSRAEFIDQLSRRRIPVVQTTADSLATNFVASECGSSHSNCSQWRGPRGRATDRADFAACRSLRRWTPTHSRTSSTRSE